MYKKYQKAVALLLVGILLSFCGCSREELKISPTGEVSLNTAVQQEYFSVNPVYIEDFACGDKELSTPEPVTFNFETVGFVPEDGRYKLEISTDKDLTKPDVYFTSDTSLKVYNLLINTTYYYRVSVLKGEETVSKTASFFTATERIRSLYIDGVTNFRDIGGIKGVKQGLIFRSSSLNLSNVDTFSFKITERGINELDKLNIVSEIDLRNTLRERGNQTSPVLGIRNYYSVPMSSSGNILRENKEKIAEFFEILFDKTNYPVLIHCNIGTDRTGMTLFLIECLLGYENNDLLYDYLFSNFAKIDTTRSITAINQYLKDIKAESGASLSEKTVNYLVKLGIDGKKLNDFIAFMKETQ